jgi:oxygen-dependent protoporphyrinogen oxidase
VLHVETWPAAIPAYDDSLDALDAVSLPAGVDLLTNYTARLGIPARVREAERLAAEITGEAGDD